MSGGFSFSFSGGDIEIDPDEAKESSEHANLTGMCESALKPEVHTVEELV